LTTATTDNGTPRTDTPGRRGAPAGNTNALRHGLRSGKLPTRCKFIENATNAFRRELEAVVIKMKGAISISDAAAINSATKWEQHGLLARYWLRKEIDKLTPSDRLRFSEAIARASDARDKAIRALDLDQHAREAMMPWLVVSDGRVSGVLAKPADQSPNALHTTNGTPNGTPHE
jgi:hypothetical protein